jgi:hypothetical protein
MAELTTCDNCGAPLADEDIFCGECGAPRPVRSPAGGEVTASPAPVETPPAPSSVPGAGPRPSLLARPAGRPVEAGWRVAFIALVVIGALACLAGLGGFVLVGVFGGEGATPTENWQISTLCCLLPFGGLGAVLVGVGALIWHRRLRSR